jgi:glycerophosphoryl diester phosphodiesterase
MVLGNSDLQNEARIEHPFRPGAGAQAAEMKRPGGSATEARVISGWRTLGWMLLAALLLAAGSLTTFRVLGAPSRGEELVRALGIPRPAIIAHRGASYLAPEETLPAFLLARELGADYLEFDVQRTRDGILVAVHDDDLSRTTNVREVFPGREKDTLDTFTFAELQRLDAGSWFNREFVDRARSSFRGMRILRVEEVIRAAESGWRRPGVYIETKAAHRFPGIERQLVELLIAHGWIDRGRSAGQVIFQSFEPESLARISALAPGSPRLLLIDEVMVRKDGWESLVRKAATIGAGIGPWGFRWASGPDWSVRDAPRRYLMTWPWYIGQAHRAGLFVHPWTIDDGWEMWMVNVGGADGLFTARPELAVSVYGRGERPDLDHLWRRIGH